MLCEYKTQMVTPLKFDESMVRRELERPFLADLNKPSPQGRSPVPVDKTDEILEKLGQRMLPTIDRFTPDSLKKVLEKYKQWEIDRIHPITARYLDWK